MWWEGVLTRDTKKKEKKKKNWAPSWGVLLIRGRVQGSGVTGAGSRACCLPQISSCRIVWALINEMGPLNWHCHTLLISLVSSSPTRIMRIQLYLRSTSRGLHYCRKWHGKRIIQIETGSYLVIAQEGHTSNPLSLLDLPQHPASQASPW
jgi:hypothetical protein